MVKIRLSRGGAKGRPFYHIVVADERKAVTAAASGAWVSTIPSPPARACACRLDTEKGARVGIQGCADDG